MHRNASPLEELARRYGVITSYPDISGTWHHAEPEALLALLHALGASLSAPNEAEDAVRAKRLEEWRTVLEPVCVCWDQEPVKLTLRLERPSFPLSLLVNVTLEDGTHRSHPLSVEPDAARSSAVVEGIPFVEAQVGLPSLPFGRHGVTVEMGGRHHHGFVLQAPRRTWTSQVGAWGVFAPTYALRHNGIGAGDFGDLAELVEWTERHGGGFVGTLPLLATFLREPFDPSPYAPVSRLFWNEFYLDLAALLRVQPCASAQRLLHGEGEALRRLESESRRVDYPKIARFKRRVLDELSREFFGSPSQERDAFERFVTETPDVDDYAGFRAVQEHRTGNWRDWVDDVPGSALEGASCRAAFEMHRYAQWRAQEQLRALHQSSDQRTGLYLDLPVGAHPDGYDAWRYRQSFLPGVCAGAPPDAFFSKGQNWGFSPLSPQRIREQGYAYVQACLRHHLGASKLLRIDHVMGLHRIFCVPSGVPASSGVYLRYPQEELFALLCLESQRHRCTIVGEDLGTVPTEVREAMDRHGLFKMYVAQFSLSTHEPVIAAPESGALATLNTHDTPPFAAFIAGLDIEDRKALGLSSPEHAATELEARRELVDAVRRRLGTEPDATQELLEKLMRFLIESAAGYVLLNLEDAWLEREPQNVPGTQFERPNWQRRMAYRIDELDGISSLQRLLSLLESRNLPE